MITCIIVDDEQHGIDLIKSHVKQTDFLQLVMATTNPFEAINKILTEKIDLVFLDMHMPQMSGIEFIKSIHGNCKVILCTAFSEYALEGYNHDVIDYLLKPISYARFMKGMQKVINLLDQEKQKSSKEEAEFVFIKTELKGKLIKINFADITHVESLGNYIGFWVNGKKIAALFTLKEIGEMLPKKISLRIHNSFIGNINVVTVIEGNELILRNVLQKIPIGFTYKEDVLSALKILKP